MKYSVCLPVISDVGITVREGASSSYSVAGTAIARQYFTVPTGDSGKAGERQMGICSVELMVLAMNLAEQHGSDGCQEGRGEESIRHGAMLTWLLTRAVCVHEENSLVPVEAMLQEPVGQSN